MLKIFRKSTKGFTLIELLIVVAIIGILAAIAIPNLIAAQTRSKNARAATDSKQIVTQVQLFINDNNCMPTACGTYAPGLTAMPLGLWDKTAPGQTIYMAATKDPWRTASNYLYTEGAGAGLTGEVVAGSVGSAGNGTLVLGAVNACSGGSVGYSSYAGSC